MTPGSSWIGNSPSQVAEMLSTCSRTNKTMNYMRSFPISWYMDFCSVFEESFLDHTKLATGKLELMHAKVFVNWNWICQVVFLVKQTNHYLFYCWTKKIIWQPFKNDRHQSSLLPWQILCFIICFQHCLVSIFFLCKQSNERILALLTK